MVVACGTMSRGRGRQRVVGAQQRCRNHTSKRTSVTLIGRDASNVRLCCLPD